MLPDVINFTLYYRWPYLWVIWRESCVGIDYLSFPLGISRLDPRQEKHCAKATYKSRWWRWKKGTEDCQNKDIMNDSRGLLCYKHSWLSFRATEINKSFLILNKAISFCVFMDLEFVLVHKNTRKITRPIFSHLDLVIG